MTLFAALYGSAPVFRAGIFVIALTVIALPVMLMLQGRLKGAVSPTYFLLYTPWLGVTAGVPGTTAVVSQRMLGGLPLSAFKRTVALQLITLALIAPVGVVIITMAALTQPQTMTMAWWLYFGLIALASIGMSAFGVAVQLRFGPVASLIIVSVMVAPIGGPMGGLAATGGRGSGALGLFAGWWGPIVAGVSIALLLAGWIWTYVELAYRRSAYQRRPTLPTTWRGATR